MAARVAASRLSSRLTMMVNRNATLASRHITSCESMKRNTLFSLPVGHRDKTSLLALSARCLSSALPLNGGSGPGLFLQAQTDLDKVEEDDVSENPQWHPSSTLADFVLECGMGSGVRSTLKKMHGKEEVKVELDLNNSSSTLEDYDMDDYEEGEELDKNPFFLPSFTAKFTKPNGTCLSVQCSIDNSYAYEEDADSEEVWGDFTINSISVIPKGAAPEQCYEVDTQNLSDELMDSIVSYMKERGLDQKFSHELVQFFQNFERKAYVKFLKDLKGFAQD